MKLRRTGGRKLALVPLFGVLFWVTSIAASTIPSLLVLGVNVHGLSFASYAGDPAQHVAPLSQQVVQDLQQSAQGGNGLSPTPTTGARPSGSRVTPSSSLSPIPSASPLPLPSTTPLPSILPTPNPVPTPTRAAISGQVIDSVTRLAIVGATVTISSGGSTTTDLNGNFSFGVTAGTYTLTAGATGYNSASQTVTVNGGQTLNVTFKLISLTATGSTKGTATDDVTGAAIAGAIVSLSNGLATLTDGYGNFNFAAVPYGTYTITASAVGYASQTQPLMVKAGHLTTVNFQLAR